MHWLTGMRMQALCHTFRTLHAVQLKLIAYFFATISHSRVRRVHNYLFQAYTQISHFITH